MMTDMDLSKLPEFLRESILPDTIRPVAEGVWFAWREDEMRSRDIRNGVWWVEDGTKIVSLGTGTGLHAWGSVDWETYVFEPRDVDIDVCCHRSEEAAERCALTFFASGTWCDQYESPVDDDD